MRRAMAALAVVALCACDMGGESPSGSSGGQTNRIRGGGGSDTLGTGGRDELVDPREDRGGDDPSRRPPSGLEMRLQPTRTERSDADVIRLLGQSRPQVAEGTRVVTPGIGAGSLTPDAREAAVRDTAARRRQFRPNIANLFGGTFGRGFRLLGGVEDEVLG